MIATVGASSPFGDEPLEEVPLASAPLARVICQVRFPRLTSLAAGTDTALSFAAALKAEYPLFSEEQGVTVSINSDGEAIAAASGRMWRLRDVGASWQVGFGDTFLALDTAEYINRADFVERLRRVLEPFLEIVTPPYFERIGVRYINRVENPETLESLSEIVRPEVLGGLGFPGEEFLLHSISELQYQLEPDRGLTVRWGLLPPGQVLDPSIAAIDSRSWVLDIDSYQTGRMGTNSSDIPMIAESLADRDYRLFRWVVKPEFLVRHGGAR